jgi:hypothetical protein
MFLLVYVAMIDDTRTLVGVKLNHTPQHCKSIIEYKSTSNHLLVFMRNFMS